MRTRFLLCLTALLLVTTGCRTKQRVEDIVIPEHSATAPASRMQLQWWADRHNSFNALAAAGEIDLVFLGDSITHSWENAGKHVWQDVYAPRNAANFGIGGDRTQHILWRIDHGNFDGLCPKLVVIMIGTNNARDNTAQEIADGVTAIVQRLRIKLPESKILLLAIFPRGTQPENNALRDNNIAASEIFSNLADERMIFFCDIGDVFMNDDGSISPDIMPDFLHLSEQGYRRWADAIEEDMTALLGE
ncbi:MAG: hypothetical protein KAS72_15230 [Phycisphaerales bacterium]|nr:hypothetical protein [Phycisphaerales bacterium]